MRRRREQFDVRVSWQIAATRRLGGIGCLLLFVAQDAGLEAAVRSARELQQRARDRHEEAARRFREYSPSTDSSELRGLRAEEQQVRDEIQQENASYAGELQALRNSQAQIAQTRPADSRLERSQLTDELNQLYEDKVDAIRDLRSGSYCSECMRTATEIERDGEPFAAHLDRVNGEPIPATPEQIRAKEEEFDRKIADKEEQLARLNEQDQREQAEQARQVREIQRSIDDLGIEHRQRIAELNARLSACNQRDNRLRNGADPQSEILRQDLAAAEAEIVQADVAYMEAAARARRANVPFTVPDLSSPHIEEVSHTEPTGEASVGEPTIAAPPRFEGFDLGPDEPDPTNLPAQQVWETLTPATRRPLPDISFDPAGSWTRPDESAGEDREPSWFDSQRLGVEEAGRQVRRSIDEFSRTVGTGTREFLGEYAREGGRELLEFDSSSMLDQIAGHVHGGDSLAGGAQDALVATIDDKAERLEQRFTRPHEVLRDQLFDVVKDSALERTKNYLFDEAGRARGREFDEFERLSVEFDVEATRLPRGFFQVPAYVDRLMEKWSGMFDHFMKGLRPGSLYVEPWDG